MEIASYETPSSAPSGTFAIVIPAYNEENRIRPVLEEVCTFIFERRLPWEVIVSIDGNDGTEGIVDDFSREYEFIQPLKSATRSGYGGAIKRAVKEVTTDYIILMEADGAMKFSTIIKSLYYLNSFDIINFNRHSLRGNKIPLARRFLSKGYNYLIRALLNLSISDVQGGYKVFKAQTAKLLFAQTTITGGFFQASLFYNAKELNLKIKEVEVLYNHVDGSKFDVGRMIMGGLVSAFALRIRHSRFYRYTPDSFVSLYYRKFRWI